jgi:hypothetical protein
VINVEAKRILQKAGSFFRVVAPLFISAIDPGDGKILSWPQTKRRRSTPRGSSYLRAVKINVDKMLTAELCSSTIRRFGKQAAIEGMWAVVRFRPGRRYRVLQ